MNYLIWGTGLYAERLSTNIVEYDTIVSVDVDIIGFVDNPPSSQIFQNKPVYTPEEIRNVDFDYIDIWDISNCEKIKKYLIVDLEIPENKIKRILGVYVDQITLKFEDELENNHAVYVRPSVELMKVYVDYYQRQNWYKYGYEYYESRKHVYSAYKWIRDNMNEDSNILEVACGMGGMTYRLLEDGFKNVSGYDYDEKAISLAIDMNRITKGCIRFFVDNAFNPKLTEKYDVIAWTDGMYLSCLPDYSLNLFFINHLPALNKNGYIIFDMVDSLYNLLPLNEYLTSDWGKQDGEKRPTEYRLRMSRDEIVSTADKYGLTLAECYDFTSNCSVPFKTYVFKY